MLGSPAKKGLLIAAVIIAVIALLATVLNLVFFTNKPDSYSETNPLTGKAVVPSDLRKYYEQKISWQPCASLSEDQKDTHDYECAKVKVPLDYKNPNGESIDIALRTVNPGHGKLGSLFINPGGPGGSGQEFLSSIFRLVDSKVQENFDIVGFDPRGVGESAPIQCLNDKEKDEVRAFSSDAKGAQAITVIKQQAKEYAQKCQAKNGERLKFMDSESSSRDLDILRAAVGDEKLSYLGYSYGTFLGTLYAKNFPDNVGRMVLDGVLAVSYNYDQVIDAQAKGFEESLTHWVQWCVKNSKNCPFTSVKGGIAKIKELNKQALQRPFPTNDSARPLTSALYEAALVNCMYSENLYPVLAQAMTALIKQDNGAPLLSIADVFADREADGHYKNNSYDAFMAINSMDYPLVGTSVEWDKETKRLEETYPILGEQMSNGQYAMEEWPYPATTQRKALPALQGVAPILIIGNTHDPATPFKMAQTLHKQLPNSRLISWDSWNHTAYGRGSSCVDELVNKYFLSGKLPTKNLECGK